MSKVVARIAEADVFIDHAGVLKNALTRLAAAIEVEAGYVVQRVFTCEERATAGRATYGTPLYWACSRRSLRFQFAILYPADSLLGHRHETNAISSRSGAHARAQGIRVTWPTSWGVPRELLVKKGGSKYCPRQTRYPRVQN